MRSAGSLENSDGAGSNVAQGRWRPLQRALARLLWCLLVLGVYCLVACMAVPVTSPSPPVSTIPPPPLPAVDFAQSPASLCQAATQIRLRPDIGGAWPDGVLATWHLYVERGDEVLAEGTWSPDAGALFIAFPEGQPLPPGEYRVMLSLDDQAYTHRFKIQNTSPHLNTLALALTPNGPDVNVLSEGTRLFYLRYVFEGVCTGSPLWINVTWNGESLWGRTLTMEEERGEGTVPCYLDDGTPFVSGDYRAVLSLMGETSRGLSFRIGEKAPEPPAIVCGPLFTAPAISPEGEPFLPDTRFEWYTQSVFAGAECRHLRTGVTWKARWFRDGKEVRLAQGVWQGGESEVVWDSLTGQPRFLLPGFYTVTLKVAAADPLTAAFRLIPYVRPEETEPSP